MGAEREPSIVREGTLGLSTRCTEETMPSRRSNLALLLALSSIAFGLAACGSDDSSSSDNVGGAGGAGVGGVSATNGTARGGASTATGGSRATVGGATSGVGGRAAGAIGGTGGQAAVDFNCNQDLACTADCTSACPGQTDTSYSCTCTNDQLECDMTVCDFAPTTCATTVTDGSDCTATDTMCSSADGNTFCFCAPDTNQWGCLAF
jgi:hypothetical protein